MTNPAAPTLAWSYAPPGATANAPGDVSVAVDQELGIVLTDVFTNKGTATAPVYDLKVYGINAATGVPLWSSFAGVGPNLPGFKGGVPMVDTVSHHLYVANPLDGSYQSYDVLTGSLRWKTYVTPVGETTHTPRAAGVFYYSAYYAKNVVILAEGHDIHTFDSATGTILNTFESPGIFAAWGINQPVIVGKQMYLASVPGWAFAMPVDFITTNPGYTPPPVQPGALTRTGVDRDTGETFEYIVPPLPPAAPPQTPDYSNPAALPSSTDASKFPSTWLAYAGGQNHNGYVPGGLKNVWWQTALNDWSIPLSDPARNEAIYGNETATHMTHLAFGVGSGVSPVKGILYAGSDRYTINALNALTGEPIWRFSTMAANFSQPPGHSDHGDRERRRPVDGPRDNRDIQEQLFYHGDRRRHPAPHGPRSHDRGREVAVLHCRHERHDAALLQRKPVLDKRRGVGLGNQRRYRRANRAFHGC